MVIFHVDTGKGAKLSDFPFFSYEVPVKLMRNSYETLMELLSRPGRYLNFLLWKLW